MVQAPHIQRLWWFSYPATPTYIKGEFANYEPSGHYMYRQFNIQQFYVLPTQTVFMCLVWIWEQTAIISLYSIN